MVVDPGVADAPAEAHEEEKCEDDVFRDGVQGKVEELEHVVSGTFLPQEPDEEALPEESQSSDGETPNQRHLHVVWILSLLAISFRLEYKKGRKQDGDCDLIIALSVAKLSSVVENYEFVGYQQSVVVAFVDQLVVTVSHHNVIGSDLFLGKVDIGGSGVPVKQNGVNVLLGGFGTALVPYLCIPLRVLDESQLDAVELRKGNALQPGFKGEL